MHSRTQEVLAFMDTQRAVLDRAVEAIPAASRETRPAPDRWSAAEVFEHLSLVEAGITKRLSDAIAPARAAGLGQENSTDPILPTLDVGRVRDRTPARVAGDAIQPRSGAGFGASAAALIQQRDELRATLVAADGLALGEVMIPGSPFGPLNVYQWVVFACAHEGRHAEQIEEIAEHFAKAGNQVLPLESPPEDEIDA